MLDLAAQTRIQRNGAAQRAAQWQRGKKGVEANLKHGETLDRHPFGLSLEMRSNPRSIPANVFRPAVQQSVHIA